MKKTQGRLSMTGCGFRREERTRQDGVEIMVSCNNICKGSRGVKSISDWPQRVSECKSDTGSESASKLMSLIMSMNFVFRTQTVFSAQADAERIKVGTYLCALQLFIKPSRFACFRSRIFQDGGMSACVVPIRCQLTQSYAPTTKTCGSFVKMSSSDVSYRVSYRGTCIEMCILSLS